jgi:hypothetical protein
MKLANIRKKRGQAAVTDLFVAIGIFIVLITITSVLWNLYNVRLVNRLEYDDLSIKAFQISDFLLKTPGNPDNWDYLVLEEDVGPDDIVYVGLVEGELRIPKNKTIALAELNESGISEVFRAQQYRVGIRIRNANGTEIYNVGKVSGTSKFSVNLGRNVLYQHTAGSPFDPSSLEVIVSK